MSAVEKKRVSPSSKLVRVAEKKLLLDFSEIPPSKEPSENTEAFEQFARDFYRELYGATIIRTCARGADDGADIIVEVGGERWLISCKHLKSSVTSDPEPHTRLLQHGCHKFIAFYAPGPSTGLARRLEGLAATRPDFELEIMDAGRIQGELISLDRRQGWNLAFRYFPRSYAKIASTLIRPIEAFNVSDVVYEEFGDEAETCRIPGLAYKISYSTMRQDHRMQAASELLSMANEHFSVATFERIFVERVADFARAFPGAFVKARWVECDKLTARDIYPSWDLKLVASLVESRNRAGLIDLCRVWSFWSADSARVVLRASRWMYGLDSDERAKFALGHIKDRDFLEQLRTPPDSLATMMRMDESDLDLQSIVADSFVAGKGYFGALICFCPGGLRPWPSAEECLYEMSMYLGVGNDLERMVNEFSRGLERDADREYLEHRTAGKLRARCGNAVSLNVSPSFVEFAQQQGLVVANSHLATECWVPVGETDPLLLAAWGCGRLLE